MAGGSGTVGERLACQATVAWRVEAISTYVRDEEVCSTPSSSLEPYASEYEGYMGNYGNTMDRWYRRAAVVLWPIQRGRSSFAQKHRLAGRCRRSGGDCARAKSTKPASWRRQCCHSGKPWRLGTSGGP